MIREVQFFCKTMEAGVRDWDDMDWEGVSLVRIPAGTVFTSAFLFGQDEPLWTDECNGRRREKTSNHGTTNSDIAGDHGETRHLKKIHRPGSLISWQTYAGNLGQTPLSHFPTLRFTYSVHFLETH